jgi:predicted dehydrogenase
VARKKKKLGIGIIGSGGIAQGAHMPGYAAIPDLCEMVALADVNEDAAKAAAAKFGVKNVLTDYKKMLEMDEIDAVSVCTPNFMHFEPTMLAFKAGKHVLCEKPIAMNATEAEKMVEAGRKAKRKFQVGYNSRFAPSNQLLKKYIDAGELGEIYWARAQALRRRGIPGWGVFIDKAKQGGGPLIDIGVHITDLTLWLMGHPKPVSASGITYAKLGRRGDLTAFMGQWDYTKFTVEDFAAALIRFDNGATISIESSFAANLPEDVYNSTLIGTEGGATTNPVTIIKDKYKSMQKFQPEFPGGDVNTHAAEVKHFCEAIINDTEPLVTGEQGLMVAKIMDAIYASSEAGKEVKIS